MPLNSASLLLALVQLHLGPSDLPEGLEALTCFVWALHVVCEAVKLQMLRP